jgi:hypothetical protein
MSEISITVDCPNEAVAEIFEQRTAKLTVIKSVKFADGKITITTNVAISPDAWFLLGQMLEASVTIQQFLTREATYRVLSPDGFDIEMDAEYKSIEEAQIALNKFILRFKDQGYYSTSRRERISLAEARSRCRIIES